MPDLQKLREQIAAGEYRFDPRSIASAMLEYADSAEPARAFGTAAAGRGHGAPPRDSHRPAG